VSSCTGILIAVAVVVVIVLTALSAY
jgi:hypothetical protein